MPDARLPVEYRGRVIHGLQYARTLGFPTANIDRRQWIRQEMKLKYGVYAGVGELSSGKRYAAAIALGPNDISRRPKIEAHLIGYRGNLHGQKISLTFTKFLREFKKFPRLDLLKKQIAADVKQAINLAKHEKNR